MFRNYFTTAWRNLKANKFYSLINISGLAVGLATGIMLLLWVQNEYSYNKFNKDYRNIYELSAHFQSNGKEVTWTSVPGPLAVFAKSMPNVKSTVRILDAWGQVLTNGDRSKVLDGFHTAYVDSTFLSIFDFKLLEGNKTALFPNINSVVLTQSTAKKFFGDQDAMGKTITFNRKDFTVTGILQDFPENSSLQYDAIFPMAYYGQRFTANGSNESGKTIDADLGDFPFNTYVKLQPGADPDEVGSMFSSMYKKIAPMLFYSRQGEGNFLYVRTTAKEAQQAIADVKNEYRKYSGDVPFSYNFVDKQFAANYKSDQQERTMFNLFAAIAIFISCLGLLGLATFTAQRKTKEIGVRKVLGASVGSIIRLVSTDFLKLVIVAIVIAIPVGWFFMNKWLENFAYKTNISWWIFLAAAMIAIVIAVLTVSFQAIRAAVANPVESLRTE